MHHVMVIYKLQINPLSILQTVNIALSLNESIIKIFSGYLHMTLEEILCGILRLSVHCIRNEFL